MKHPLLTRCTNEIKIALHDFGHYTFGDKGPDEVMNIGALVKEFRKLPATEAAAILLALSTSDDHGQQTASSIIVDLQDWDELFTCPDLQEIDW